MPWISALLVVKSSSVKWRKRGASCARVMAAGRTVRSSHTTRHPARCISDMCVECGSRLILWRRFPAAKRQSVSEQDQWPLQIIRKGGKPALSVVGFVPNVNQSFGGMFKKSSRPPGRTQPKCKKLKTPWQGKIRVVKNGVVTKAVIK